MLMPSIFGENLFDSFFDDFDKPARKTYRVASPAVSVMKTDIKENENGFELLIDLPGYKKENVKAELKDGYLTISAEAKHEENKESKGNYVRRERYYGAASRSYYVGEEETQEDIKARFEDGVINVYVPKKEKVPEVEETKYISIE